MKTHEEGYFRGQKYVQPQLIGMKIRIKNNNSLHLAAFCFSGYPECFSKGVCLRVSGGWTIEPGSVFPTVILAGMKPVDRSVGRKQHLLVKWVWCCELKSGTRMGVILQETVALLLLGVFGPGVNVPPLDTPQQDLLFMRHWLRP